DSSESMPCRAWVSTGTPSTGSSVWAATIPGRCAAPPAPAMMTSRPRASASPANSAIRAGVRCAETTRHSWGTSNGVRVGAAGCSVSKSDFLPRRTATSGALMRSLLALAKREARLAVERAEVLGLDEVEAGVGHPLQQRDDLRVRDAAVGRLEAAGP